MKNIKAKAAQRKKLVGTFGGPEMPMEEKQPRTFKKPPMPPRKPKAPKEEKKDDGLFKQMKDKFTGKPKDKGGN